jgi:hypothetical protein
MAFLVGLAGCSMFQAPPHKPQEIPQLSQAEQDAIDHRVFQEGKERDDCDAGKAGACIDYQRDVNEDASREQREFEGEERQLDREIFIESMTPPF